MRAVVIDRVCSGHKLCVGIRIVHLQILAGAGIEIPIKTWEVAAGNLQTKHVAFLEDVARGPNINREFVNLPRIYQRGCFLRIPIAGAENSFSQVLREAIGPDVNQLSREVGIDRRRFGDATEVERSRPFDA